MADSFEDELRNLPAVMTPKQLADFISTTTGSLSQDRYLGKGIPFTRIGARVRYLKSDVVAYLAANRVTSTA